MANWPSIFNSPVAEVRPAITETAAKIDTILQTRPQADQEIQALLSRQLGGGISETTGRDVKEALSSYLCSDAAYLIFWAVQPDSVVDRLTTVDETAPPRVAAFIRAIVGLYGPELKLAFNRVDQPPNDWSSVNREIYVDLINNNRLLVKFRINKYNGEQVIIEGEPYTILELAANMLRTCNLIGSLVGKPEAFTDRTIDLATREIDEFLKLVRPAPKDESEQPVAGVIPAHQAGGPGINSQ